jgi:hypothetical protein
VKSLTSTKNAQIEPMDAFVLSEPVSGTVRLYRFEQRLPNKIVRHFYTAFEPNMKEVVKQPGSKLHPMKCFVFPHTYKPLAGEDVVPVFEFYNPDSGEHFLTTSLAEKDQLIKAAQDEQNRKLEKVAARYRKLRKRDPAAVALREMPLTIGDVEWRVVDVRDLGHELKSSNQFIKDLTTSGHFLWVEIRVENKGKSLRSLIAPILFDEQGRSFYTSSDAHFVIPKEKNLFLLKNLNPGLTLNAVFIFEVPKEAPKLTLLAGDLDPTTAKEGAIDLGM